MIHHLKIILASLALTLAALSLSSCSPKVQTKTFSEARQEFSPSQTDVRLQVRDESADDLIKRLAGGASQKISTSVVAKVPFENSPLVNQALDLIKPYTNMSAKLIVTLDRSKQDYNWPSQVKLSAATDELIKFVEWVASELRQQEVAEELTSKGLKAIRKWATGFQESIDDELETFEEAETATEAVETLSALSEELLLESEPFEKLASEAEEIDAKQDSKEKSLAVEQMKRKALSLIEKNFARALPTVPQKLFAFGAQQLGVSAKALRKLLANPNEEIKRLAHKFAHQHLNQIEITSPGLSMGASLSAIVQQVRGFDEKGESASKETKTLLISLFNKLLIIKSTLSFQTSLSVGDQAEILQGLSDSLNYLKDWEQNGYDTGLGALTVANVLGLEGSLAILQRPAFEKSLIYSLTLATCGEILAKFESDVTPVFLISPTEPAIWANEQTNDSRAMAGIVDLRNGVRQKVTRTGDLGRLILALGTFLKATEEIEQTKAAPLLEENESGKSRLSEVENGRSSLKLLLMAFANLMSHKLQLPNGSFVAEFDMQRNETSGQASSLDRAVAIKALTFVSELLDAKVYLNAALDGYFAMNRDLWSDQLQFYTPSGASSPQTLTYDHVDLILKSLDSLSPHLPTESYEQWQKIVTKWRKALELLDRGPNS